MLKKIEKSVSADQVEKPGRREFLTASGKMAALGTLGRMGLFHFVTAESVAAASGTVGVTKKLETWDQLYRHRWQWDKVVRGSHGWANCRSACNWNLYIKDGVVVREEQAANYLASEPGVPDFNPRGCQKGACYTDVMYGASRLTVPMKRVGERGEGKWVRISWTQAIHEIAEKMVDIGQKWGTESISLDLGPHFDFGATTLARFRFVGLLGGTIADDWAEIGDLNAGASLTFGLPHIGGSSDEWFLSDYLVVWMMNPSVTQIPDAHFLYEAKYKGAELVVVDPIYSATAIHADLWVPVKPGTDAALGLATARHIWTSGNADIEYLKEQTDFPILVRLDTGRFLRESDLKAGGQSDMLYLWDSKTSQLTKAPGCMGDRTSKIALGKLDPVLEGSYEVRLHDGATVKVATVGSLIREHLEPWTFDRAAAVTAMSVDMVKSFAEGFAKAKRPMVLSSWGSNRYVHSDQMNRSKILCLALKGAMGRKGSGFHSTGWVGLDGFTDKMWHTGKSFNGLRMFGKVLGDSVAFNLLVDQIAGRKSNAQFQQAIARNGIVKPEWTGCMTNNTSLNYNYFGVKDDVNREMSPHYPRPFDDYVKESEKKNWMPPPTKQPRMWMTGGNNLLRRTNLPQRVMADFWKNLELIVDINQKLSFTGMNSDYLLPGAGYYEKPGIKYLVAYVPYLHYCGEAVKPIGDSKNEWEIYVLLAEEISRIAKERGITNVPGRCSEEGVDLSTLHDRFTIGGKFGVKDAEALTEQIIEDSPCANHLPFEHYKKNGIGHYANTGEVGIQEDIFNSDWKGEGVLTALTDMTERKFSYPTLTGRQQFYIDHPWFIEAGEAMPAHIESPEAGGDHPFQMISCHARWSIHSIWRDNPLMLRLERGEPLLYLNPRDAESLKIGDNEWALLENRYGRMRMRIKHSTMVRPKVAYYFHAWEPHQFPEHKSYKVLTPGIINPLHYAGGEGHLGYFFGHFSPGTHVQDTRVSIRPWNGEQAVVLTKEEVK